ncbi:MAG: hypothetical protein ACREE5_03910 [Acetobacteraceae bacterium]
MNLNLGLTGFVVRERVQAGLERDLLRWMRELSIVEPRAMPHTPRLAIEA